MSFPTDKYVLKANPIRGEMLLINDGNKDVEEYFQLADGILSEIVTLDLSPNVLFFPFDYVEEYNAHRKPRLYFNKNEWILAAVIIDGNNELNRIFIVNTANLRYALLIDAYKKKVLTAIYDSFIVQEEEGSNPLSANFFLSTLRHDILPKNFVPRKKPPKDANQEENEEPIVIKKHAFVSNSKKSIPKLDIPTKKPKEEPIVEEVEDEEEDIHIEVAKPAFESNKKNAIPNLDANPNYRKAKPGPEPLKKKSFDYHPVVPPKTVFTPNKKPGQIVVEKPKKEPKYLDKFIFWLGGKKPVGEITYFERNNPTVEELLLSILDQIASIPLKEDKTGFRIFAPETFLMDQSKIDWYVSAFTLEEWNLIALIEDSNHKNYRLLFSNKKDPYLCLIASLIKGELFLSGMTTNGVVFTDKTPFEEIIARLEEKDEVNEENVEELLTESSLTELTKDEVIEKVEKVIGPLEEINEQNQQEETPDDIEIEEIEETPHRSVYVTRRFQNEFKKISKDNPGSANEALNKIYDTLIFSDDEQLKDYLSLHSTSNKKMNDIETRDFGPIYKFHLGNHPSIDATRVFYCRPSSNEQLRFKTGDFLLIGVSSQSEHDYQARKARDYKSNLDQRGFNILNYKVLRHEDNQKQNYRSLAHMSPKQYDLLNEFIHKPPVAFFGPAGSGKTLISVQNVLDLKGKVLYVTYEKTLLAHVKEDLKDLGLSEEFIHAYTFKDLCLELLQGKQEIKLERKDHFRKWFYDLLKRNNQIRKACQSLGGNKEDQFNTVYVFYRGTIDGASDNFLIRKGNIIPKNVFLDKIKSEEAFTRQQKEAIYEVAKKYEEHLKEEKATTDNKLAYTIIKGKMGEYDAIIIDEFQDFTEMQFRAVLSLLKNPNQPNIFIYGDENQTINPTLFDLSDAESIIQELFGVKLEKKPIEGSYRSGPILVNYINQIAKARKNAIGLRKAELEIKESSRRVDDDDIYVCRLNKEEHLDELVKLTASSSKDVVFLFPSAQQRDVYKSRYKDLYPEFVDDCFKSVAEAKGQQWDAVVLVCFLKYGEDLFDGMLSEEKSGHHSSIHRMLFNRYYVALTRAENSIFVYEPPSTENIEKKLLAGVPILKKNEIAKHFNGIGEAENWIAKGDALFAAGEYEEAEKHYNRVASSDETALAKAAKAHDYALAKRNKKSNDECINLYIDNDDGKTLLKFYRDKGFRGKQHLLSPLLTSDEPSNDIIDIFSKVIPNCSIKEKVYFFGLLSKTYKNAIFNKINTYRKEN